VTNFPFSELVRVLIYNFRTILTHFFSIEIITVKPPIQQFDDIVMHDISIA